MKPQLAAPDRQTWVSPLGIRFWDPATNSAVMDGLIVKLRPAHPYGKSIQALVNRSGVHVLHEVPGLAETMRGEGDKNYWLEVAARTRQFTVEVTDSMRRFHDLTFQVQLPTRGYFVPPYLHDSPYRAQSYLPLYSTPSRLAPNASAVIRTELRDGSPDKPTSWAMLTAEFNGQELGCGIADKDGKVALIFPYPEPARRSISPPPGSPPAASADLFTWQIRLRAFYSRQLTNVAVPDLEKLLAQRSQNPARLMELQSPPHELGSQKLFFGKELVVRSSGSPYLFISPA